MTGLDTQHKEWVEHRARLEQHARLLIVEDDPQAAQELEEACTRQGLPSRTASSVVQALEQLRQEDFALALISEGFSALGGLYFARQVRLAHPEVETLICTSEPTVALFTTVFELRILDVVTLPLPALKPFGEQIHQALQRSIDRRMRSFVLNRLRDDLKGLPPEHRLNATRILERRLSAFKARLGAFDRVLVVEEDDEDLRILSEHLHLAGLHVEAVDDLEEGIDRARDGSIHLILLRAELDESTLAETLFLLRSASPVVELMLVSPSPSVESALAALLHGAAFYTGWPPDSTSGMVLRVQEVLRRSRKERLIDNLLLELYQETHQALGTALDEVHFQAFRKLLQLSRAIKVEVPLPPLSDQSAAVSYLDEVLDHILAPEEELLITNALEEEGPHTEEENGAERRAHLRVQESQFIRFRQKTSRVSTLALMGDLSEGGLFVRSPDLLLPGTLLDVDFNVMHQGEAYLVRCRGQVAWVARDSHQSPLGPGFGIKFIDPPLEVAQLMKKIVQTRSQTTTLP